MRSLRRCSIFIDAHGDVNITIPIADSITTWRMAMLASTRSGALGSATSSLRVFQDFFVDLDLPVTLTQGDRVSIPVAVYNYSGRSGNVCLKLQPEEWFSPVDDSPEKNIAVESSRVGASQFTIHANRIGKFKLTLTAHMDGAAARRTASLCVGSKSTQDFILGDSQPSLLGLVPVTYARLGLPRGHRCAFQAERSASNHRKN